MACARLRRQRAYAGDVDGRHGGAAHVARYLTTGRGREVARVEVCLFATFAWSQGGLVLGVQVCTLEVRAPALQVDGSERV